jgi:DNA (cytosine-5)-methyltransferase 1
LNEFLHPSEDRPLTLRECARLQTFPDDFRFVGTTRECVQLIGNAVPPSLAYHLACSLKDGLAKSTACGGKGALLSFVPTLSSGMSPVLHAVTKEIHQTFCPTGEFQLGLQWL